MKSYFYLILFISIGFYFISCISKNKPTIVKKESASNFKDFKTINNIQIIIEKTLSQIDFKNGEIKRETFYNMELKQWVFIYQRLSVDSGFKVFIVDENSKYLEVQWGGASWKEKVEIIKK